MDRLFKLALPVLTAVVLMSGCAVTTTEMPLSSSDSAINPSHTPLMLMSLSISNESGRDITTSVESLTVRRTDKPDSKPESFIVGFDETAPAIERHLLRLSLAPGNYEILSAAGTAFDGNFLNRKPYVVPLHLEVSGQQNGVHYLGHIDATLRPRQEQEFYAGPTAKISSGIGLIRINRTVRLSGLTFDVVVSDQMGDDIPRFKEQFDVLANRDIERLMLPAFDRPKVEKIMAAFEASTKR